MIDNKNLLLDVCNTAIRAGDEILKYYNEDIEVTYKNDASPLTKADLAANKLIMSSLNQLDVNIPILSEELIVDWSKRKKWNRYWLVDPLDGTKEFIKKNGEFTVNIALIENNKPILGVIFAPAKSKNAFLGQSLQSRGERCRLPCHRQPENHQRQDMCLGPSPADPPASMHDHGSVARFLSCFPALPPL